MFSASLLLFGYYQCAAAIVDKNYVITLADCVKKHSASDFQVRVGSSYFQKGGTLYNVKSLIAHPKYNSSEADYDIALIKLQKSIKFNKNVKKIALAMKDLKAGEKVVLSGWGNTLALNDNGFYDAAVTGVDRFTCNNTYSPLGRDVEESMICAGASGIGPCDYDFGDPLVAKNKLYGIFSWGYGCGVEGYPAVYASVPATASWIKKTIKS